MAAKPAEAQRRPFTGSCHCGNIKYVVYITVPPELPKSRQMPMQCLYRCNCTTCQKTGVLHLRLADAPSDFALLSPLDPFAELGDYLYHNKKLHWLFCKTCGVRCFTFMGKHEVAEEQLPGFGADGEKVKFWRPAKGEDGFREGRPARDSYLSVNAMTIDAGQEGADLVDWADRNAIAYNDALGLGGKPHAEISNKPHQWGCY